MNAPQRESGELIQRNRRFPKHCLYCRLVADSVEHIVPEAIGGRLTANILCREHNGIVNIADEPLSKNFAPFVTMLQVSRQRGGVGAEFQAIGSDGKPMTIVPEGFAKQKPVDVVARDANNRIVRVTGDLKHLDAIPVEAFPDKGSRNIMAVISNPEGVFEVESTEALSGGVLKIGLHFFAGFVADVPLDQAEAILPYIVGEKAAGGSYVRTPYLAEDTFPESWPPRHEVTAYPADEYTLVTVLLFGAYAYTCRLPLRMAGGTGLRYRQVLSENFPQFFEGIAIPASLDWEKRGGPGEVEAWSAPIRQRLERIHDEGIQQAIRARCRRAYDRALGESHNLGDLWTRYKAALELEAFPADEVLQIIGIGKRLAFEAKNPWEIPVVSQPAGPNRVREA